MRDRLHLHDQIANNLVVGNVLKAHSAIGKLCRQTVEIFRLGCFQTDQHRAEIAGLLFQVFKPRNVVFRSEHEQEVLERSGALRHL